MAKKKMPQMARSSSFKKGNKGGPGGKSLPEEIKVLRRVNQANVEELFQYCFTMTKNEIREFQKRPAATAMELAFSKCCERASEGSLLHLTTILDRMLTPLPVKPGDEKKETLLDAVKNAIKQIEDNG